ncbi:MAG: SDR family NAD(P)-dependent oxidoreductase [Tardiphaga sp.]
MTTSSGFGKVIVITDAGSDSGEAIARHLASQGHRVMLGARSLERIAALARDIARSGGVASYQEVDVSSRGSVRAFLVIAEVCFERIDVLVNTAGSGIVAALPVIEAQGVARVIHVPTDHALHARAIAEAIGGAVAQPDHVDVGEILMRTAARA